MSRAISTALLLLVATVSSVRAQSAQPHEQVFDLATIEAAHAVCDFALSDEQRDTLEQRRQALMDHDGIAADEIDAVTAQVTASLQRQRADGLCRSDGPEAAFYRHKLAEYGLL